MSVAGWFFGLLALGLLLLWLGRRARTRSGLPQGRVVYTDTGAWGRPERALFSRALQLAGKPDYLVDDGGHLIPVEVKSGRAPARPYPSHVLQVAAYCLLVEESHGRRPPHGIVKYADRAFQVDYTSALEDELLETLENMKVDLANGNAPRDHADARRCRACGYREQCDESLV